MELTKTKNSEEWFPQKGERYFSVSLFYVVEDINDEAAIDKARFAQNNYFKTKRQAEDAKDFLLEKLLHYKKSLHV